MNRQKDERLFEQMMRLAMSEFRRVTAPNGIGVSYSP